MTMMIDATCPACNRRIGWSGTMKNRPACHCGHRPPQEELDAAAARMEALHERLRTHPGKASADVRRQQRIDAGLTLRQAAKLLGITPSELSDYENCRAEPVAEVAERMAKTYGCGE